MRILTVFVLMFFLVSSFSLAATAPTKTQKTKSLPVAKAITSSGSNMKMGLASYLMGGTNVAGVNLGGASVLMLKFIGETYTSGIGVNYLSISANNANTSVFGATGLFAFHLTGGTVPIHLGASLSYNSIPSGSLFTVNLIYGAEAVVTGNLLLGFDLIPVSFSSTSQNNATTTSIGVGSAAVYAGYIF
ncbi:hypothetical protein A2526_04130 [candidate division WOR-1 bacterium RIFOXYD2_FULL_36_8]|uniref:Outer membrane protein beta-barrel domain-containing protein n=1 Tax=candidate division WOR-1 bacterium RIFOXYB2_FULL_36_35 TaxID=1802578 RepID=A0A1F4S6B0_UNCSA|nr:MAG: hypothetical protein A2230_01490 [candidate division WOR-1 bacterium RIFOXYA2_FULL_36_21]OGC14353.1 MAG: hypothetical protein A2282_07865 [candidate division WOR-1 bacterium RIFOXYA12_FULL_36_13]OGC15971.1 MAG: hypothetical protein A2290_06960 [candidate division WOR-1 bacterium RIFOXYB2_FULL_36_35]OGC38588.1 MAG: hypothetical protein A2526_04130 [candidate division WOR-1 bacterium RIFOXYD2_FULL_36_8]